MAWLLWIGGGLALLFGTVVLVGPPYLPTMRKQTDAALDLLALTPGQTLLELGSGDGRVMRAAAMRGLNVIGIELNPLLVLVSLVVTWRYRKQVRVKWANYWSLSWPPADGIFTFMLTEYMSKLDKRVAAWRTKPLRLASFAFQLPGRKPIEERLGVYLYEYK